MKTKININNNIIKQKLNNNEWSSKKLMITIIIPTKTKKITIDQKM